MISPAEQWLLWAREVHALAQTSHHYASNEFERQRAQRLMGIAGEIISGYSGTEFEFVQQALEAQPGYVTPKVDVRAAVFEDDRLLFVREAIDGGWTLPGGWADVGDTPSHAIEREVMEEAGLEVQCKSLIGVYDANRVPGKMTLFHAYKLLFFCQSIGGSLAGSHETSEASFFSLEELPAHLSSNRTTPRHIHDAFDFHRDPTRPVVFD